MSKTSMSLGVCQNEKNKKIENDAKIYKTASYISMLK